MTTLKNILRNKAVVKKPGNPPCMAQLTSCSSLPDGQCLKPSHHNSELMQAPNSGQLQQFKTIQSILKYIIN